MTDVINNLPIVELHLHIEGTFEPELILEVAARNGIALPSKDADELRARYEFADLQSFLNLYYDNLAVLQHEQDFFDLTTVYLRRAAVGGVVHAEIFFDPQAHTSRGVDLEAAAGGVARALQQSESTFGISTGLIVTFLRDRPVAEALQVLRDLIALKIPMLGVGLDSAEVGNPPGQFKPVFDLARDHGLRLVAHAGEEGPPAYISEALDVLGVQRVDHGIRCLEDPQLVERLVAEQIPLTVCPFSNVRLRAVDALELHPILEMLNLGLLVTVNSDDPAYFGGYVDDNYRGLAQAFALSNMQLATLATNGVKAAFVDDKRRAELLRLIDAWVQVADQAE